LKRKIAIASAFALLAMSGAGFACTDSGAFGVKFGTPVPGDAASTQHRGGSVSNAMGCFFGSVPEPFPGFDQHAFCANKDRKSVYGLEGYVIIDGGRKISDGEDVKRKAREIVARVKQAWQEKFGLQFKQDHETSVLSWTAETDKLYSHISVDGQYVVVECTNKALEGKALGAGLKSM
jgi:hypothetical protein